MWRDGGQADKLSACSAVLVWSASARNMSVFAAAGGATLLLFEARAKNSPA